MNRFGLISIICLLGLGLFCLASTGVRKSEVIHTQYLIFIDQTGSISSVAQRNHWVQLLIDEVLGCMQPGDCIQIFAIHDRTRDAAPLYMGKISAVPQDAVMGELQRARSEMTVVRREAGEAIQRAMTIKKAAKATDLLGAIDRCHADPCKWHTKLIFASDMLHSSSDINLERTALPENGIGNLVAALLARHGWPGSTLAQVQVYCLLNNVPPGASRPVNGRRILRQFWTELVISLGGELVCFETHFAMKSGGSR
ncbi:MAG: hypothetical protein KAY24_05245 [Candidatus Eisenbacteria sp.]|nr:hypothetical protein [Candidatus Eisenbacteria bacterium]